MNTDRQHERLSIVLVVEYRTAGAFLVAYSVNLSSGGMFIETEHPHPVATPLAVRIAVPGQDVVEVEGMVVWIREQASENKPQGMGVRFGQPLDVRFGELIDKMAVAFRGLRTVVVGKSPVARALLTRGVRTTVAASSIVETDGSTDTDAALSSDTDLVVIDLGEEPEGLMALRLAKTASHPVPAIVVAPHERARQRARELGADEVLNSPPAFADLQAAILRALSKPLRIIPRS
ncbi:MAG: TIGR02266 family protein [Pseudomonadota bacterium]